MKIKTNSQEPGEPKDPDTSTLFEFYRAFASTEETVAMRERYAQGIAWGEMKQQLFEVLNRVIGPARERYQEFLAAPEHIESVLLEGAQKARAVAAPFLDEIRRAAGIRPLYE